MDTHDTGGHANYEDKDSMFRFLRVRGKLPAGSIITVEPGVSSYLEKYCEPLRKRETNEGASDLLLSLHY